MVVKEADGRVEAFMAKGDDDDEEEEEDDDDEDDDDEEEEEDEMVEGKGEKEELDALE